jgi:hypothetical protein
MARRTDQLHRTWIATLMVGALLLGVLPMTSAAAQVPFLEQSWYLQQFPPGTTGNVERPILQRDLLSKAPADECFNGIGAPYPDGPPCDDEELPGVKPKVNQAYVWGLARTTEGLWYGTAPNVHCMVQGAYLGAPEPQVNDSWVCEFGESQASRELADQLAQRAALGAGFSPGTLGFESVRAGAYAQIHPQLAPIGDWRPPRLYWLRADGTEVELTGQVAGSIVNGGEHAYRFGTTIGIRSAGALDGVVLFAGPAIPGTAGPGQSAVNVFAFRASDGNFLGSHVLLGYSNIRKWLAHDGVLYTGVAKSGEGGAVLRWNGDLDDPFQFSEVGLLDTDAAELAVHKGRLYVSTWPAWESGEPRVAGLRRSPVIPTGGLTATHANDWEKVFDFSDYEPDPVTAMTYGGGALVSWGDHLYWGTMHVPLMAMGAHSQRYGQPADTQAGLDAFMGTHRAIAIFRASEFGGRNRTELLYGHQQLPVYREARGWALEPNVLGQRPRFGTSGFGNPYNNYTWTMDVHQNRLYVGTMDWSYLFDQSFNDYIAGTELPPEIRYLFTQGDHGADLWRFDRANSAANAESVSGVGNPTNYGIRTMLVQDDRLFLGSANPMNLMIGGPHEGGWELLRLQPPASGPGPRPRK